MLVKCQWCSKQRDRDTMTKDKKGYFCPECYSLELEERERKRSEVEQLDALVTTILRVHDMNALPKSFYPFIQDIRNGTVRFQGPVLKKHKSGIPYPIVLEAYELSAEAISWAKRNKIFRNDMAELKYGLAVVRNKMNEAYEASERRQKHAEQQVAIAPKSEQKVEYKKKQHKNDISQFLEDEVRE